MDDRRLLGRSDRRLTPFTSITALPSFPRTLPRRCTLESHACNSTNARSAIPRQRGNLNVTPRLTPSSTCRRSTTRRTRCARENISRKRLARAFAPSRSRSRDGTRVDGRAMDGWMNGNDRPTARSPEARDATTTTTTRARWRLRPTDDTTRVARERRAKPRRRGPRGNRRETRTRRRTTARSPRRARRRPSARP